MDIDLLDDFNMLLSWRAASTRPRSSSATPRVRSGWNSPSGGASTWPPTCT